MFFDPKSIAIKVIEDHTGIKSDSMFFINRDRTTYYNLCKRANEIIQNPMYKHAYEKIRLSTTPDKFTGYKDLAQQKKEELSHTWESLDDAKNQL